MTIPETVKNYLNKRSSDKWKLEWERKDGIENVVVVPAISEFENIKRLIESLSKNDEQILDKSFILFVVNNLSSSTEDVKGDNKKSIEFLSNLIFNKSSVLFSPTFINPNLKFGYVDASSKDNELDNKSGGVGLARKIGMDLALTVFDHASNKKKIVISLDADCVVENSYLPAINHSFNEWDLNAATIEFAHSSDSQSDDEAILCYEIFLRYYVIGLLFAKSHFAYHTIGSAFACDIEAYIKVGGMNTRQAAEDFYFLQKLAKVYPIYKINSTIVRPSARQSWRVPFGTGKSLMEFENGRRQFSVYDPNVFIVLKEWNELFDSDYALNPEVLLHKAKDIHLELYYYLIQKDFPAKWRKILENCNSERQLNYQRRNWFDAFNTLKLIHHLRDTAFPMQETVLALPKMFDLLNYDFKEDYDTQIEKNDIKKYLNALIKIENSFLNILLAENKLL